MIKLSELQLKEVIAVKDGSRLGFIDDLEIDPDNGQIIAIIVAARSKKTGLFKKQAEIIIAWEDIVTIGADVILAEFIEVRDLFDQNVVN